MDAVTHDRALEFPRASAHPINANRERVLAVLSRLIRDAVIIDYSHVPQLGRLYDFLRAIHRAKPAPACCAAGCWSGLSGDLNAPNAGINHVPMSLVVSAIVDEKRIPPTINLHAPGAARHEQKRWQKNPTRPHVP